MLCPKCGIKTRVLDSRDYGQRRRRQCMNSACGHRFATTEIVVSEKAEGKAHYVCAVKRDPPPPASAPEPDKSATVPTKQKTTFPAFSFALTMPPGAAVRLNR
ncbi:NrdR family transcriptional regulator [Caballeronia fortuita]|uniref:NrdR family transcriptional regulator n=1 Tax=Caballeronia fortuita TaxID=1777138 RepID=UPI004043355D